MEKRTHKRSLKNYLKWILCGSGTMATVFIITIGPWPLDLNPDLKPETTALGIVRIEGEQMQEHHAELPQLPLAAGWAMEPFVLPDALPMAGYGARRGASSTGIMAGEILAARSVVLQSGSNKGDAAGGHTVAIICADMLLINRPLAEAVKAKVEALLGTKAPELMFTATHTHSGPGGWGEMVVEEVIAGRYDPEVFAELVRALSASVVSAVKEVEPAEYAWIKTQAPQYLRNRTVKGADVDATLEALVVRKTSGEKQTALLALFGAHATCFSDENLLLSCDYPGPMVRTLEATSVIDFAAFSAGNVGSHSPVAPSGRETRATTLGKGLADLLLKQLEKAEYKQSIRLSFREFKIPTPKIQVRITPSWRASPIVTGMLHEQSARFSVLRLDDHLWVGVPAEVSGLLSKPLREHARENGLSGLTTSSFQADYLGYVIPDSVYSKGSAYEAKMSFLGPTGGSYFNHLMQALIESQKTGRSD